MDHNTETIIISILYNKITTLNENLMAYFRVFVLRFPFLNTMKKLEKLEYLGRVGIILAVSHFRLGCKTGQRKSREKKQIYGQCLLSLGSRRPLRSGSEDLLLLLCQFYLWDAVLFYVNYFYCFLRFCKLWLYIPPGEQQ